MDTKEDLIRQIPLFASLPPEEVRLLASSLRFSEFPEGSILFREGDPGEYLAIITEGQVVIIQASGTPEERILNNLGPGDFLGEIGLLDPDHLRSATARAETLVKLLVMTSVEFDRLIHRHAPDQGTSRARWVCLGETPPGF
jgi:CRP/FNR family transcriptional regulator, cyclic AMP receptor protein